MFFTDKIWRKKMYPRNLPSSYAEQVDFVMIYIVFFAVLMLAGVVAAMIYFALKYNRKKHPKPEQIEGSVSLEIIWTVIPTIIALSMFYFGFTSFKTSRNIPEGAIEIKVVGKMWAWEFFYPNGIKTDSLYVPVDKSIKLTLTSADVNHSFFIPAFRIKEDVVAGRENYMVIHPLELGSYDIACAEYCGLKHAFMYTKMHVIEQDKFEKWMNSNNQKPDL